MWSGAYEVFSDHEKLCLERKALRKTEQAYLTLFLLLSAATTLDVTCGTDTGGRVEGRLPTAAWLGQARAATGKEDSVPGPGAAAVLGGAARDSIPAIRAGGWSLAAWRLGWSVRVCARWVSGGGLCGALASPRTGWLCVGGQSPQTADS